MLKTRHKRSFKYLFSYLTYYTELQKRRIKKGVTVPSPGKITYKNVLDKNTIGV